MPLSITQSLAEASDLLATAPSPVVVIPVYESYEDVVKCYAAVLAHTADSVSILVVDDAGADRRVADVLVRAQERLRHNVVVLVHERNAGFVSACNDAFEVTAGRDVVLVNSDVVVGPEWLERLTAAATSSSLIATASTLTNHGTILSVPLRNHPISTLPQGLLPDEAARRVAAFSPQLRPSLPTAVGHCMYIRRFALDLVGGFDPVFGAGYGEEVDFSQRASAIGLRHVCADDVFTYHRGGGSFGISAETKAIKDRNERILHKRYPWYSRWAAWSSNDAFSPLAQALGSAQRALQGMIVAIDATCLGTEFMGTQHVVVETIRALGRSSRVDRLVVLTPPTLPPYAKALARELPHVHFVDARVEDELPSGLQPAIVYRPYQVGTLRELDALRRFGARVVVNQLDVIAFSNPAYFRSGDAWLDYREVTRLALATVDGVAFISESGRDSALAEGVLGSDVPTSVVYCGTDAAPPESGPQRPPAPLQAEDDHLILCLGASYHHKNRVFAVRVFRELRARGWRGRLVLAGPTPPDGNSLYAEAEEMLGDVDLGSAVVTLGAVSDAEKAWLFSHAALVLYPTLVEGFGLVPFEAAACGVPTLATRQGSLAEVMPADIPAIDVFDARRAADLAWDLLTDDDQAKAVVERIQHAGQSFTWDLTGDLLVDLFEDVLRSSPRRTLVLQGESSAPVAVRPRIVSRSSNAAFGAQLERLVGYVVDHPRLKVQLSPDGSTRQRLARTVINRARRQL